MALFLKNHSTSSRIVILGHWLSKAFLNYRRPPVLEWTNDMSTNMTTKDTFANICQSWPHQKQWLSHFWTTQG
jgi:hypothetical protein